MSSLLRAMGMIRAMHARTANTAASARSVVGRAGFANEGSSSCLYWEAKNAIANLYAVNF